MLNLYTLVQNPTQLSGYPEIIEQIPKLAWDHYRNNNQELKAREHLWIQDVDTTIRYVLNTKQRWPEAEQKWVTDANFRHIYILYILKQRWPEAELYMLQDFIDEDMDSHMLGLYLMKQMIDVRWPEIEPYIAKIPYLAYIYANYCIRRRFHEAEHYIVIDVKHAYMYARYVLCERWPEAEHYIKYDPGYAYSYARDVIKGKWPEAEPYIMYTSYWELYEEDVLKC